MPLAIAIAIALGLMSVALAGGGLLAIRLSGSHPGLARRLAGARQLALGDLLSASDLPKRPIRVSGRIRCPDPIVTSRQERLVALHRDVQVRPPGGGWRSIERVRETRGFELWDHDGAVPIDPAEAAEPLIAIPHIWRGTTAALEDPTHRAAAERLGGSRQTAIAARSVTRMLNVVDRLLVLASVGRDADGAVVLRPPPGGYVIAALELDDAMRVLGGPRRRLLLVGYGLALAGAGAAILALGTLMLAWLTGAGPG
jgi:hypothetical protein